MKDDIACVVKSIHSGVWLCEAGLPFGIAALAFKILAGEKKKESIHHHHCDPDCPVQTPNRASGPKWEKNGSSFAELPKRCSLCFQLSMVAELASLQFLGCTISFLLVATFSAVEHLARRGRKLGSSKLSGSANKDGPSRNC